MNPQFVMWGSLNAAATVFVTLVLLLAGLLSVYNGARLLRELRRSRCWPETSGSVVESEVKKRTLTPASVDFTGRSERAGVRYRYAVDDVTYESDVIELGGRFRQTPGIAARQVAHYCRGKTVTVFYNPAQPRRACLERRGGGAWGRVAGGVLLILLAALVGLYG